MEVAILPPQDCLKRHHHHHNHKHRRYFNPTPNPSNQPNRSNHRRRHSNSNSPPPPGPAQARTRTPSPPVSSQLRILKHGEGLPQPKPASSAPQMRGAMARPAPFSMEGFYAGSACVTSPPPSELPLPVFFTRSRGCGLDDDNQKIASDLRRVLKLC